MAESAEESLPEYIVLGVIEGTLTLHTNDPALADIAWKGFQFFATAAFARRFPEISEWVSLRFELQSIERGSFKLKWKAFVAFPGKAWGELEKVPGKIGKAFAAVGTDIKKSGVTAVTIGALGLLPLPLAVYPIIKEAREQTAVYCPQSSPTFEISSDYRPVRPGEKCPTPFGPFGGSK